MAISCQQVNHITPEDHVMTFNHLFPKSHSVEWGNENGFAKVEFWQGGYEKVAWFNHDGTWVKTVTEIPLSEAPAAVTKAIRDRLGEGWTIDDIDLVEQKDDPVKFYLAECEHIASDTDIYIAVYETGSFINENDWKDRVERLNAQDKGNNNNNQNNGSSQASPQATFAQMYPTASNVEWENEHGMVKVEFKIGYREKEAWFLADGTWVKTVTEIPLSEVPAAVISALKNRLGNAWQIDDIDLVEQKDAPTLFYLAECEKRGGKQEIHLRVTPDGTIL